MATIATTTAPVDLQTKRTNAIKAVALLAAIALIAAATFLFTGTAEAATINRSANNQSKATATLLPGGDDFAPINEAVETLDLADDIKATLSSYDDGMVHFLKLRPGSELKSLNKVTLYGKDFYTVRSIAANGDPVWILDLKKGDDTAMENPTYDDKVIFDLKHVAVIPANGGLLFVVPQDALPQTESKTPFYFMMTLDDNGIERDVTVNLPETDEDQATTTRVDSDRAKQQDAKENPVVVIDEPDSEDPYFVSNVDGQSIDNSVTGDDHALHQDGDDSDLTGFEDEDSTVHETTVDQVNVNTPAGSTAVNTTVDTDVTENANGNVEVVEAVTTTVDSNTNANANANETGKELAQTSDGIPVPVVALIAFTTVMAAGIGLVALRKRNAA